MLVYVLDYGQQMMIPAANANLSKQMAVPLSEAGGTVMTIEAAHDQHAVSHSKCFCHLSVLPYVLLSVIYFLQNLIGRVAMAQGILGK